ncbi:Fic family protein [Candidatus Saganbacteria bacterium]|uniref:Fic family protein n=1 Tax=Candidatus Saganbacteria bacterium TaxID=2575572 RepID=A0A9D6UJN2_UNCSA|nr:Fic family protein [Candidatus Saganbacteria bacterium]
MNELSDLLIEIDRKKALLDKARPLPAIIVDRLSEYFNVEWTYTSNAIEGNSMTRQETLLILKDGLTISGKSLREHLEITNHKNAIDYLGELLTKIEPVNQEDVKAIHRLVLEGIDNRYAGKYREVEVYISGSKYVPPQPQFLPGLMLDFSKWLVERQEQKDAHPVRFAAQAHFKLVDVHPFIDGNGRTARLVMNLILMKYGYPIAVFECEEEKRKEYYRALDEGHHGNLFPFEIMTAKYVNESMDKYMGAIPK